MGRFINADAFASTGQGLLGNNMFAYCNNSPVSSRDDTGCYPIAVEDKFVHDQVLKNICTWNSELTYHNTCIYYNQRDWMGGFGFCDLYNKNTGEVWELKKANFTSYSCSTPVAQAQLSRYTHGRLKYAPDLDLLTPYKTIIPNRTFEVATTFKIYTVSYWYEGDGILRYSYASKNTSAGYVLETLAVLALLPMAVCGYPAIQ